MAAAPLPTIIILALGAATLGGPDALRALLEFTGQSPCLDIAISVFVMFVVTAYLLGTVLLVRFVRDARPGDADGAGGADQGHGAAPTATDCLAQVSLLVSVCVGFLVAACLVVLPSIPSGGLGTVIFSTYFDGKNSFVAISVAVIGATATSFRCTRPVLRFVRGAGNAGDGAPGERFSRTRQTVCFIFIALLLAAASGGLDAQSLFSGFPCRSAITNVPVGVAIAAVAGTALVVRFSRGVRNAAGAAARPMPTGTWRRRFVKLTSLAVVAGVLAMAYAHSQSGSESDGGEHANSALCLKVETNDARVVRRSGRRAGGCAVPVQQQQQPTGL